LGEPSDGADPDSELMCGNMEGGAGPRQRTVGVPSPEGGPVGASVTALPFAGLVLGDFPGKAGGTRCS
jgi:hypothetical protein